MSQKLGRNYSLSISGTNFPIPLVITLPFTLEFDITRNTLTSANVCQVRLYNLSPQNRNKLRRAVTTGWSEPLETITLRAGYSGYGGSSPNPIGSDFGVNLPVIFSGNVSEAHSYREGINFVTQIECYDGGFAFVNGQVPSGLSFPKGTPYKTIITALIASLPNITVGAVGNYLGVLSRTFTPTGSTIEVLKQLTGGGFFIDNGMGYALGNNEYSLSPGPPPVVDAASGLLNTPILENGIVTFNMIFEPSLSIGTGLHLVSKTLETGVGQQLANYSGFYKITSVKHRGIISQTVCGDAVTTGQFFFLQTPTPVVSSA